MLHRRIPRRRPRRFDRWLIGVVAGRLGSASPRSKPSYVAPPVPVTFHSYDARHSFFNERMSAVHSPENAQLAWERTIAFLNQKLA